ncbi:hypothetical protein BpHYR1_028934 [Brachionus plicatilis]|uniref:Uncharacterized protein n=1 Tax=Brachionus plicatilis TaxID=10195 RepID=A0A3M7RM06_BRAPC|nr:hypothetical protein BpHYR1_028934 [Brachionus plicatilis]
MNRRATCCINGFLAVNFITSGDEDKSPRRLIKVLLGGSNVYSACNGYLTSVVWTCTFFLARYFFSSLKNIKKKNQNKT